LTIPFAAVIAFADPSVNFGLQFEAAPAQPAQVEALPAPASPDKPAEAERPAAEIVTLDKFRKR
jgi:hypothetical protein